MKITGRVIFLTFAVVILTGCGVTRHIPSGSYLLKKNVIETDKEVPKEERISADDIDRYIRQQLEQALPVDEEEVRLMVDY